MTERPTATRGPGAAYDERQRDIIEAVFAIVDGQGTEQVTIRNVAKAAGISPGRVQYYFPTKDALLSAAFTAINDLGTENIQRRLAADPAAGPEAILLAVLTELVPADDAGRRLIRIVNAFEVYALNRPELAERLADGYSDFASFLASLLPAGEAEDTAKELIALASGLGWMVVVGAHTPEAARRTVTACLHRLFASLPRDGRADVAAPVAAIEVPAHQVPVPADRNGRMGFDASLPPRATPGQLGEPYALAVAVYRTQIDAEAVYSTCFSDQALDAGEADAVLVCERLLDFACLVPVHDGGAVCAGQAAVKGPGLAVR